MLRRLKETFGRHPAEQILSTPILPPDLTSIYDPIRSQAMLDRLKRPFEAHEDDLDVYQLGDLVTQNQFVLSDYLGERTLDWGFMRGEYPIRIGHGLSYPQSPDHRQAIQGVLNRLAPLNRKELIKKQKQYEQYFGVSISVDDEQQEIGITREGTVFRLKPGGVTLNHDTRQFPSDRYRTDIFPYSTRVAILSLMIYPHPDIKQFGLVAGDLQHNELSTLIVPGHYLSNYTEGYSVILPLDPECLYVIRLNQLGEDIDWLMRLFGENSDFLQDVRPVGVINENPQPTEITIADATERACCGRCGQVYPDEQEVVIVHGRLIKAGNPVCSHCGVSEPVPYSPSPR